MGESMFIGLMISLAVQTCVPEPTLTPPISGLLASDASDWYSGSSMRPKNSRSVRISESLANQGDERS